MVNTILDIFPDAHIHSGYARVRCPYHKDGKENKPSMSILLEPRGSMPAGTCHCFACGKVIDFDEMLRDLGYSRKKVDASPRQLQPRKVTLTTTQILHKSQLPFRYSAYLNARGISKETQERFKIYEKDKLVHMPIFTREGLYAYDCARSITSKKFFVESGATKSLWGIEEIDFTKPIAVCESQIDALSFWEVGVQAVATLGADNIACLKQISSSVSTIILAFDPDNAGIQARQRAVKLLGSYRCKYLELPAGVDVNQALQDIQDRNKFKDFMRRSVRSFVQK